MWQAFKVGIPGFSCNTGERTDVPKTSCLWPYLYKEKKSVHVWATCKDTKMGEDMKILVSHKEHPTATSSRCRGWRRKMVPSSVEAESFIHRQEPNTLASQRDPLGKTLWATLPATEEGHHHPLVLARQWFPVSAPGFTTGSKLLQSPCHRPKQLCQASRRCGLAGISWAALSCPCARNWLPLMPWRHSESSC